MADDTQPVDFEDALAELETLVGRMESGELTLEESLKAFERGVQLTRDCQRALQAAELRVRTLTEDEDGPGLRDLALDDEDN